MNANRKMTPMNETETDKSDIRHCDHVKHSGEGWKKCVRCGSLCERDKKGKIEVFTRRGLRALEGRYAFSTYPYHEIASA